MPPTRAEGYPPPALRTGVILRRQLAQQPPHRRDLLRRRQRAHLDEHRHRALDVDRLRRVERLQEDLLDGVPELDLHDLDAQREVGEAEAHHLGQGVIGHLVVAELGKEVEAEAALDTAGATAALRGVALGDEGFDEAADLALLVESGRGVSAGRGLRGGDRPHLAMLAGVDNTSDIRDSDTSLSDVGR